MNLAVSMNLATELERLVARVEVVSRHRLRIDGRLRQIDPTADPVATLAEELYRSWFGSHGGSDGLAAGRLARRRHLGLLAAANNGSGTWQPGWSVGGVHDDGMVAADRYGVVFHLPADELRTAGSVAAPGEACRVLVPPEMRRLQPRFYAALGDADQAPPQENPHVVRLYWHLRAAAAPDWVRAVTSGLNALEIPFTLKAVSEPAGYRRADAGVLYLEPRHFPAARQTIRATHRAIGDRLRPPVPPLTLRLAPGLGIAEGPADGASFGRHRCRLIAGGITEALAAGSPSPEERLEAVRAAFEAAGLDPARPYLAAGSRSDYRPLRPADRSSPRTPAGAPVPALSFTECALRIGDALCRSAYRADDRCNWVGGTFRQQDNGRTLVPAIAALPAKLYDGTAGVALFLAHLYAASGETRHRETALAAQRQALAAVRREPGLYPPTGFLSGQLGVAWAAYRVAALTGSAEVARSGEELLTWLVPRLAGGEVLDLVGGDAGAVLALLRLWEETQRGSLREAAGGLGRQILAAARRHEGLWTWDNRTPSLARLPPLTGLAHGAAGIGLALLELAVASRLEGLREAADGAFAYEEACYDAGRRNWPDFRTAEPGFTTAWCHGAAGIALSRLRAMRVDPIRAARYEAAARAGLATTLEAIARSSATPGADTGLCHGLCGLVDVALTGAEVLGEEAAERRAREAMELAVARYGESASWPTGEPSHASNPCLFTGTAGVGYALLRLDRPARVPSALLPAAPGDTTERGKNARTERRTA